MTTTREEAAQHAELTLRRRLSHLEYSRDKKRASKALEFIDAEIVALRVALEVFVEAKKMRKLLAQAAEALKLAGFTSSLYYECLNAGEKA